VKPKPDFIITITRLYQHIPQICTVQLVRCVNKPDMLLKGLILANNQNTSYYSEQLCCWGCLFYYRKWCFKLFESFINKYSCFVCFNNQIKK